MTKTLINKNSQNVQKCSYHHHMINNNNNNYEKKNNNNNKENTLTGVMDTVNSLQCTSMSVVS